MTDLSRWSLVASSVMARVLARGAAATLLLFGLTCVAADTASAGLDNLTFVAPPSVELITTPITLSATGSLGDTGAITDTSLTPVVCAVGATTDRVTFLTTGVCTIQATQAADIVGGFAAATTTASVTVEPVVTVTFNGNGSTGGSMAPQNDALNVATRLASSGLFKTGYTFAGWDIWAPGTTVIYTNTQLVAFGVNTTLYAVWTPYPVAPPVTGPAAVLPPDGLPPSTFGVPASAIASSTATTSAALTLGLEELSVTTSIGALASGTVVSVYPIVNAVSIVSDIPANQSYVASAAVTLETSSGSSPVATMPVTLTITDPNIAAGDIVYEVTPTGLQMVSTVAANGSSTVSLVSDGTFVLARSDLIVQVPLRLTSISGKYGKVIMLASSGGSGTGAVGYSVVNAGSAGCFITGGTTLNATRAGSCTVIATRAADATFGLASSTATKVTFYSSQGTGSPPAKITTEHFAENSWSLSVTMMAQTARFAGLIKTRHLRVVTVSGYASSSGSKAINLLISHRRADAVARYLETQLTRLHVGGVSITVIARGVGGRTIAAANRIVIAVARRSRT